MFNDTYTYNIDIGHRYRLYFFSELESRDQIHRWFYTQIAYNFSYNIIYFIFDIYYLQQWA